MIHETGNRILNGLEQSFGYLALPQILRWIAGFQVLTWGLSLFSPDFLEWITYNRDAILSGQVWRLFSWVLYPTSENPLFVLIALLFMFFINDGLEGHWGSFRLTVYVIASVLVLAAIGLIPVFGPIGSLRNMIFYASVFLAFASLFPNQIIHLFLIIPIKVKWLGWIIVAGLLFFIISTSPMLLAAMLVVGGLLPYLLTFVPAFVSEAKQRSETTVRRHRFEAASAGADEPFHLCKECGATDESHPERSFRVMANGEEICDVCLAKREREGKS